MKQQTPKASIQGTFKRRGTRLRATRVALDAGGVGFIERWSLDLEALCG